MASGTNSEMNASEGQDLGGADATDQIGPPIYHDTVVKQFLFATLVWAIFATLAGLLVAHLLVIPKMFGGQEWLSFGRVRPLHTNTAIYAFLANGLFAAIYYSTQRLCQVRIWSVAFGQIHFWLWQAIILSAVWVFPRGIAQGREFSQTAVSISFAMVAVWILFFASNFFMTLWHRRVARLYVSLWFYIVTIVTLPILLLANSIVLPINWIQSYPLVAGVHDSVLQWCYGHTAMMYLLLMPFLGILYYLVPLVSGRPLNNYRLAIVHFWALVIFMVWAGPHRLHYTPIPEWISSMGMLVGLILWMPMWGGLINGWKTLRGGNASFSTSIAYRFLWIALLFYGLSTVESFLLSIKSVSSLTHYSDWTIAHIHTGVMGWNGMLAFAMIYWLLPRLFRTKLWSERLSFLHFWIAVVGTLLTVVPLYVAGLTQSWMWNSMDELGNLVYPDFMESILASKSMWWIRIMGGLIYLAGSVLLGINVLMTWLASFGARSVESDDELSMHKAVFDSEVNLTKPTLETLENAPVLDSARTLSRLSRLAWHSQWETSSKIYASLAVIALLVMTIFQVVPVFLVRGNVPVIASVKPYTALELAGRDLYLNEGCVNCHSQTVRPLVAETKRYGDYSRPGEFVFDFPPQWGSRRIGPDLAREGGKQTSLWHWQHLENPTSLVDGSVMPSYSHLLDTSIDFEKIGRRVETARKLGVAYELELDQYVQDARNQAEKVAAEIVSSGGSIRRGEVMTLDSQAVALIAYLQRLGKDLNAPAEQPRKQNESSEIENQAIRSVPVSDEPRQLAMTSGVE